MLNLKLLRVATMLANGLQIETDRPRLAPVDGVDQTILTQIEGRFSLFSGERLEPDAGPDPINQPDTTHSEVRSGRVVQAVVADQGSSYVLDRPGLHLLAEHVASSYRRHDQECSTAAGLPTILDTK